MSSKSPPPRPPPDQRWFRRIPRVVLGGALVLAAAAESVVCYKAWRGSNADDDPPLTRHVFQLGDRFVREPPIHTTDSTTDSTSSSSSTDSSTTDSSTASSVLLESDPEAEVHTQRYALYLDHTAPRTRSGEMLMVTRYGGVTRPHASVQQLRAYLERDPNTSLEEVELLDDERLRFTAQQHCTASRLIERSAGLVASMSSWTMARLFHSQSNSSVPALEMELHSASDEDGRTHLSAALTHKPRHSLFVQESMRVLPAASAGWSSEAVDLLAAAAADHTATAVLGPGADLAKVRQLEIRHRAAALEPVRVNGPLSKLALLWVQGFGGGALEQAPAAAAGGGGGGAAAAAAAPSLEESSGESSASQISEPLTWRRFLRLPQDECGSVLVEGITDCQVRIDQVRVEMRFDRVVSLDEF